MTVCNDPWNPKDPYARCTREFGHPGPHYYTTFTPRPKEEPVKDICKDMTPPPPEVPPGTYRYVTAKGLAKLAHVSEHNGALYHPDAEPWEWRDAVQRTRLVDAGDLEVAKATAEENRAAFEDMRKCRDGLQVSLKETVHNLEATQKAHEGIARSLSEAEAELMRTHQERDGLSAANRDLVAERDKLLEDIARETGHGALERVMEALTTSQRPHFTAMSVNFARIVVETLQNAGVLFRVRAEQGGFLSDDEAAPEAIVTAEGILLQASELVNGDRAKDYGDASESFRRIATLWSALMGHDVTPQQVAILMAALKLSRLSTSPGHRDSWVDLAGYAALGGQVAE